jgi:hypothetical protein
MGSIGDGVTAELGGGVGWMPRWAAVNVEEVGSTETQMF